MSDFLIAVGVIKVMFSTLLFVSALLIALNRTLVQDYFQEYLSRRPPLSAPNGQEMHVVVVTDYISCLTFLMAASVMRMISGIAIFVGEYSEMMEVRVAAILSYALDMTCLALFLFYCTSERLAHHLADSLSLGFGLFCGLEFVVFVYTCISVTFSMHEFAFKAKWEELKRKRKAAKARKARKAKEAKEDINKGTTTSA